ncbi:membrane protein [Actinocatenispora thailandica]|uniref:Membrane protein n=1 Tax=Actinocatenispora thailandica TaxID=227318 RepID=A0A7R7HYU3_9ACTN|nr:membrane protein [Actinocatenispora thailandica]
MGFPENLLVAEERVALRLHPHWKRLVGAFLFTLLVLAAAIAGVVYAPWQILRYIILGLAVLLLVIYPLRRLITWATTHYVFTTHRILLRSGVISRKGRDIPLDRINDVSFEHNLFERMLGCGTLVIESAGEHGQIVLKDVPHVERTHGVLYQLVEQDDSRADA